MRRILSTGSLLLALTGAAWSMPACDTDDREPPDDADLGTVDTMASHDVFSNVDTSAPLPDAGAPDALDDDASLPQYSCGGRAGGASPRTATISTFTTRKPRPIAASIAVGAAVDRSAEAGPA
jgi:hypothetical protein